MDIAYDYTKRPHVFRLQTYNESEYMFQTEDHESMLEWIQAIETNNDPDNDVSCAALRYNSCLICCALYILANGLVLTFVVFGDVRQM